MAGLSDEMLRRRLEGMLLGSRFLQFSDVEVAGTKNAFVYASHYAHHIQSQVRLIGDKLVILSNGFLSSHAYNVGLTIRWCLGEKRDPTPYLRHHYKKFFAECVLHVRNRLAGRALLLETLLYEQDLARPMFEAADQNAELREWAKATASVMSFLVSQHELAHVFERRHGHEFRREVSGFFDGRAGHLIDAEEAAHGKEAALEVQCDAVAAHMLIAQPPIGVDETTARYLTAFGFAAFADLLSLQKSADATAESETDDGIDLSSAKRSSTTPDFLIGRHTDMDRRAALIDELTNPSKIDGMPSLATAKATMRETFETFLDPAEETPVGMTGTDDTRRGLARMVAESLHDHPKGAEFLLWRSKQFAIGGETYDP